MADTVSKYQREREYRARTQRLLHRGHQSDRASTIRLAEVGFEEAHEERSTPFGAFDLSTGRLKLAKNPKEQVRQVPDCFSAPSSRFHATKLHQHLRKPRAEDERRMQRIEQRIIDLQRELRDLKNAAWDRGIEINPDRLKAAVAKRKADAERGYRRDSKVPKV